MTHHRSGQQKPPSGIFTTRQERKDFLRLSFSVLDQTRNIPDSLMGEQITIPEGSTSPSDAFSRALLAQKSEMKGMHKLVWLLYGIILTSGLIYYSGGTAALLALTPGTDLGVGVAIGLMTGMVGYVQRQFERNLKAYEAITTLRDRLGHERFIIRLAHIHKTDRHLDGPGVMDLLTDLPTTAQRLSAIKPKPPLRERLRHAIPNTARQATEWFVNIGHTLDRSTKERAALTEENPSALFQHVTKGHRRKVLVLGASAVAFVGCIGASIALTGGPVGLAFAALCAYSGKQIFSKTRRLSCLFGELARLHTKTGPEHFPALLDHARKTMTPTPH